MYDLYLNNNENDEIINKTLNTIIFYIKQNKNNNIIEYGNILINPKNEICILWGLTSIFKKNTYFRDSVKKNYKNTIVVEQGYLNRQEYLSFTLNEQAGLSRPIPSLCDDVRFNKLKIDVKPLLLKKDGYILFCSQLPWDRQTQFLKKNYNIWLNETLNLIKKTTNRKIVFRFHPKYFTKNAKWRKLDKFKITLPDFVFIDKNKSLLDSFKNAYVTISYNSTALIDSIINGVPIMALHKMTPIFSLATKKIRNIENIYIPGRKKVLKTLYNISYMQWNLDEIRKGYPFEYLLSILNKNKQIIS